MAPEVDPAFNEPLTQVGHFRSFVMFSGMVVNFK